MFPLAFVVCGSPDLTLPLVLMITRRYVILPKDFEKGYKANVKKSDTEFAFYQ